MLNYNGLWTLFVQIPDYNPDLSPPIISSKPLPSLVAVTIVSSAAYRWFLAIFYLFFFATAIGIVWPYLYKNWLWGVIPCLLGILLAHSWRQQIQLLAPERTLWFEQERWYLESQGQAKKLSLVGDVVVWPWLVLMDFQAQDDSSQRLRLIILKDSVSDADFRRLSCWLRVCLKPKR